VTEDEAKTKDCCGPPVVAIMTAIVGAGKVFERSHVKCHGASCMAWRWNEPWTSRAEEGHGGDIVIRLKRKPGEPKLGYCGLAGSPQ